MIKPDFSGGGTLLEEEHYRFHASAQERAAGADQHTVQVTTFQQHPPQTHGGVVCVGEEGVLDDDARTSPGTEHLDEMLQEQERGFARADGEILLHSTALPPKGLAKMMCAGPSPECPQGLGERVRVNDARRFNAVESRF